MSLHHVKLVHGSEPNRSGDRRIGLAIRYIPTDLKQLKVRDSATLVRGVDRYGNFDLEPRPKHDLDEAARAAHADAEQLGKSKPSTPAPTSKHSVRDGGSDASCAAWAFARLRVDGRSRSGSTIVAEARPAAPQKHGVQHDT